MSFVAALTSLGLGTTAATIGGGALTGAAAGAGLTGVTNAIQGKDIFDNMGMGALTGAVTGGAFSGLGALGNAATAAEQAGTQGATSAATQGAASAATQGIGQVGQQALTPAFESAASQGIGQAGAGALQGIPSNLTNAASASLSGAPVASSGGIGSLGTAGNSAMGNLSSQLGNAVETPLTSAASSTYQPSTLEKLGQKYNSLSDMGKYAVEGATGLALSGVTGGLMGGASDMPDMKEDESQFGYNAKKYAYSPRNYTPLDVKPNVYKPYYMATGGIASLGAYSDGGRLAKGPGTGISDDIPAYIDGAKPQPARIADGEFVIPARIVSELGQGSTDAGARKLYGMMDRINAGRKKTTKRGKFADDTHADRHLPA